MMSISSYVRIDSEQLLRIQRGDSYSLNHANTRIRLVDDTFRRKVKELEVAALCTLILAEIASGRVIVETRDTDGKISAITSKQLQHHEKTKKYEQLEVKEDSSFFEELAKVVQENLEAVTTETAKSNANAKKHEAEQQTRLPNPDARVPLPFVITYVPSETVDHFVQAPGIKKITQRMLEDAIEQSRRSQEHKIQEQKRHKQKRERQIDKDNRLFERNHQFHKVQISVA